MENNKQIQSWFQRWEPFIAVVFLQCGYAGMDVLSKVALNKEMSCYVFAVPVIGEILYLLGLKYTTAAFVSAMGNTAPAITFFMASILRLEKIQIKSIRTHAKVIGTLVTLSGAMVITLMKGPILGLFGSHRGNNHNQHNDVTNIQHPIKGAVMITIAYICYSLFVILHAITLESYPAELSLTAWICLLGVVEGAAVALIMERGNLSVWCTTWDIKLLAVAYNGIVCSGLAFYLQGVMLKTRGPVFVTAFSPLTTVIAALVSSFFLGEQLYLAWVIGAIVIVLGLYLVVWGKSKDYDQPSQIIKEAISSAEQIQDEGMAKKEHINTQKVVTIGNSGEVGITTLNEQV
ncbi:hypothetical protein RIF29_20215 [Crotalaria pallida]|uniref:WAT1-related protein n=1 Tax=Crotalaria pallida TaxID=3830 RepID=A0AAN9F0U2_CROPI